MAELARGRVNDRPWGWTLGALARRGLTGQLDVRADGRVYSIAFNQGVIFGAASALPNDSAVRVAMTGGLVSSTQVNDLMRRISGQAGRDEIELIAEALRLAPDQAQRLRRRVVAQRAARTFSVEDGDFVVNDQFTIGYVPGSELDIRSVVYLGARSNLADERLDAELARMGTWFQLRAEATDDLPYFGFADGDRPVLQQIARGTTLSDLHAAAPEIDGHTKRAIVYSLVSCGAADASTLPGADLDPPTLNRTRTGQISGMPSGTAQPAPRVTTITSTPATRTAPTGAPAARTPAAPLPEEPSVVRMRPPTGQPPMQIPVAAPQREANKPKTARAKRNTAETRDTEALIKQKLEDSRGDHFQLLGVPKNATPDLIRSAYFNLARKLHPDRLSSLGISDDNRDAQRLFAQINTAFAVLNDDKSRAEYLSVMSRGGEAAVRQQEAAAEEMAAKVMRAEESFKRGEMALRRDQITQAMAAFAEAVELQPNEAEYQALLAWTRFASAPDKNVVANDTRKALQQAADKDQMAPTPRFYLGRVERMLGREREALSHFQAVLAIKPNHVEAASEVRVLQQRLKR
jgi:hypothetical protein